MGYRFNSFYRDSDVHPFVKSMVGFLQEADKSSMLPDYVNVYRHRAKNNFQSDITRMREISLTILKMRRENPSGGDDLLNALLYGRDPKTGEGMSDESIINNLITFLVAGHETTSGALSFVFYYLLINPESLKIARDEVDRVIGTDNINADHLSKLPYIDAVLKEALRLNPTAPGITLGAREDTILGGRYAVKKGEPLLCLFHNIHRDKKIYGKNADEWKPERMLEENFNKLPKNAWKPFGNGARGCIGRAFAWQESQLVSLLPLPI
jgi:cytochrome P450/NADPH-cytochrome P450 reductase